jgi:hypothetical protein
MLILRLASDNPVYSPLADQNVRFQFWPVGVFAIAAAMPVLLSSDAASMETCPLRKMPSIRLPVVIAYAACTSVAAIVGASGLAVPSSAELRNVLLSIGIGISLAMLLPHHVGWMPIFGYLTCAFLFGSPRFGHFAWWAAPIFASASSAQVVLSLIFAIVACAAYVRWGTLDDRTLSA